MQFKALRALVGITTGKLRILHRNNQRAQSVNEHTFWLGEGPQYPKRSDSASMSDIYQSPNYF